MITNLITREWLNYVIKAVFLKFQTNSIIHFLDCLKCLGFGYATISGLSSNIESLKIPSYKVNIIKQATKKVKIAQKDCKAGIISETEKFQIFADNWSSANDFLRRKLIRNYKMQTPTNPTFMMAYSGSRGNIGQIRQLVGMRGLMSDSNGSIMSIPVLTNFKEGLSIADYLISAYGARKGVVDTSLKTATSGYLTRRLVYLAQQLIIREIDCKSTEGLIVLFNPHKKYDNLSARILLSKKKVTKNSKWHFFSTLLTPKSVKKLKIRTKTLLNIRSPLSCYANEALCQHCYGWNIINDKYLGLGLAVGIMAAQAVGEPGTQLTMRTFHTGGAFSGNLKKRKFTSFSGKLIGDNSFLNTILRTPHGQLAFTIMRAQQISLTSWKGKKITFILAKNSYFYQHFFKFLKKGSLLSEPIPHLIKKKKKKNWGPIYSPTNAEIFFPPTNSKVILIDGKRAFRLLKNTIVWFLMGDLYVLSKEISPYRKKRETLLTPFCYVLLSIPQGGFFTISKHYACFHGMTKFFNFNFSKLDLDQITAKTKISTCLKNFQYFDDFTILSHLYFFTNIKGNIYRARKKTNNYRSLLFLSTTKDVWQIYSHSKNLKQISSRLPSSPKATTKFKQKLHNSFRGIHLDTNGLKKNFYRAIPYYLAKGTLLKKNQNDFIQTDTLFGYSTQNLQNAKDIVQGLPKIKEILENIKPNPKATLAAQPGIFFSALSLIGKNSINCKLWHKITAGKVSSTPIPTFGAVSTKIKKSFYLYKNFFQKKPLLVYSKALYSLHKISLEKKTSTLLNAEIRNFRLFTQKLKATKKLKVANWKKISSQAKNFYRIMHNNIIPLKHKKILELFRNKWGDVLLERKHGQLSYLRHLTPVTKYYNFSKKKIIFNPGQFVDIGKPCTNGKISAPELLHILFNYHSKFDGTLLGAIKGLRKFQLILVNSLQALYHGEKVRIFSRHFEVLIRQLTNKAIIKFPGHTPFLPGEVLNFLILIEICISLKSLSTKSFFKVPNFEPLIFSGAAISESQDSFLTSSAFQKVKLILTESAIEGRKDWLSGLKESVAIGRVMPAGSTFLNYKNYLDSIYFFKT